MLLFHFEGALVKKMLESKKELEGSKNQVGKKTEIVSTVSF